MPGRFPLFLVFLAVSLAGCASYPEERLSMLESAVMDLQANGMRLSSLEETVAILVASQGQTNQLNESVNEPEKPRDLKTTPAPRKISPAPRPVEAPAPPPTRIAETPATVKPTSKKKINSARAADDYRTALATLESGRPQSAMAQFQDFLRNYPGHALAPNAGYWLGECSYAMKRYDVAIMAFRDVVAQYPTHDKAAAAMLKAGYSYAQLGDTVNARFYLEALLKDYPSSQPASLARTRLATL